MRICAWGDSITYGACDTDALGWVGRLRKKLFLDDEEVTFYNRGVGGDTSSDLLKRVPIEYASLRPEISILAIGINDSLFRESDPSTCEVSITDFEQNLLSILSVFKQSKSVFVIGLTRVTESLVQPLPWSTTKKCYANSTIADYDAILKRVSAEQQVTYIDVSTLLQANELMDGLHPNANGYDKIADRILGELERVV